MKIRRAFGPVALVTLGYALSRSLRARAAVNCALGRPTMYRVKLAGGPISITDCDHALVAECEFPSFPSVSVSSTATWGEGAPIPVAEDL